MVALIRSFRAQLNCSASAGSRTEIRSTLLLIANGSLCSAQDEPTITGHRETRAEKRSESAVPSRRRITDRASATEAGSSPVDDRRRLMCQRYRNPVSRISVSHNWVPSNPTSGNRVSGNPFPHLRASVGDAQVEIRFTAIGEHGCRTQECLALREGVQKCP